MPLFGGPRDISLFHTMNRELLNDIIQTEIGFYKYALNQSETNLYGESERKVYYEPILIPCLIKKEDQSWSDTDFGPNNTQQMTFSFLKYTLEEYNLVPEVGDIILFTNNYFELNSIIENQYIAGKNPDHSMNEDTDEFGKSFSLICNGVLSRVETLNVVPLRSNIYPTTTKVEQTYANPRDQLYS